MLLGERCSLWISFPAGIEEQPVGRLLGWHWDAKGLIFEHKRMAVFPLSSNVLNTAVWRKLCHILVPSYLER